VADHYWGQVELAEAAVQIAAIRKLRKK